MSNPAPGVAALVAVLAVGASAHAQSEDAGTPAVPDASLRAMTDSVVLLEVEGSPAVEGRLVGFEAQWVTVVTTATNEVVSVPRERLVRMREVGRPLAPPAPAPPERERIIGLHFGITVSLMVDVQWGIFYGFTNGNVLFPLTTLTGSSSWIALATGAGVSLPLAKGSRWHADLFGQVLPLHVGGAYSYVAFGLGAGLRFAGHSGFTFAIKAPLFGYSARVGRSPNGYDTSFRPTYAFGYYYLAGLMGLPLVSLGYRF